MDRVKRLSRLEHPAGDRFVPMPGVFHFPANGTDAEQHAFERDIDRRRLAGQVCAVVGPGGFETERDAWDGLMENFV